MPIQIIFNEIKEEVVHLLRNIDEMDVPELMDAVKKCMTYKLEINDYLDMMAIWYRDVLIYKSDEECGPGRIFGISFVISKPVPARALMRELKKILEALETAKHE